MRKKHISILFILIYLLFGCGGTADNLSVGDDAPIFTLEDVENNSYSLSDFKGKSPVIIYFYPKASTPGCTKQACGIRDDFTKFEENGIKIFGISVDSKKEIKDFIDEYSLNFPLLSDETKQVSEKYGVLNKLGFSSRLTFVIDKNGKLAEIIRDVDIESHSKQIFEMAQKLL